MTSVALALAGLMLAVAAYVIYRLGPGSERRTIICPEKKLIAEIKVVRREGSFATLLPPDVVSCTLIPGGPIDCSKACLQ